MLRQADRLVSWQSSLHRDGQLDSDCTVPAKSTATKGSVVCSGVFKTDHNEKLKSDILTQMPNTTERREIANRVNAKEAETILQSKELVAKTKRLSAIAGTKNLARRDQALNDPSRTQKNTP